MFLQTAAKEKREWIRFPSNLDVVCWMDSGHHEKPIRAQVRNISAGGFGFSFSQGFAPGTALTVRFCGERSYLTGYLQIRIAHAQMEVTGDWYMGCQFSTELTPAERKLLF